MPAYEPKLSITLGLTSQDAPYAAVPLRRLAVARLMLPVEVSAALPSRRVEATDRQWRMTLPIILECAPPERNLR